MMRDVEFDRKTIVFAVVGLVVGIVIGLIFAWLIVPVDWEDATPEMLREDLRVDHLRMVIDSYSVNLNAETALRRYNELGEFKEESLEMVAGDPDEVDPAAIQKFQALVAVEYGGVPGDVTVDEPVTGEGDQMEATPEVPGEATAESMDSGGDESAEEADVASGELVATPVEAEGEGLSASRFVLPVCGATLLIGLLLAGVLILRRRIEDRETQEFEYEPMEEPQEIGVEEDEFAAPPAEMPAALVEPLATFRTTYSIGDDLYDDSFSIENPATGDFLGECGVGIAEALGVGDPKKVSAFEVWLFDKNDIQTVTKIIMSKYTFADDEARSRLSAKGDPVQAESGQVVALETASLLIEARIVDLIYGEGALPGESYFERLTIELKALPKNM